MKRPVFFQVIGRPVFEEDRFLGYEVSGQVKEKFRQAADYWISFLEANGYPLPVSGITVANNISLIQNIALGWFRSLPNKPSEITEELAKKYTHKAMSLVENLNSDNAQRIHSRNWFFIAFLPWEYIDWFHVDWDWVKWASANWTRDQWKALREGLLGLGMTRKIPTYVPDYMNAKSWLGNMKSFPVNGMSKEGPRWMDIPWREVAWNEVPVDLLPIKHLSVNPYRNSLGSFTETPEGFLFNLKESFIAKCKKNPNDPADKIWHPKEGVCIPIVQVNSPPTGSTSKTSEFPGGKKTWKDQADDVKMKRMSCEKDGYTYDPTKDKCVSPSIGSSQTQSGDASGSSRTRAGDASKNVRDTAERKEPTSDEPQTEALPKEPKSENDIIPTEQDCLEQQKVFWPGLGCVDLATNAELAKLSAACDMQKGTFDPVNRKCMVGGVVSSCQPPNTPDPFKGDCLSPEEHQKRAAFAVDCAKKGKFYNPHTATCDDKAPEQLLCADGKPAHPDPSILCDRSKAPAPPDGSGSEEKKSSTLPWILGGLAVAGVGAVVWLSWRKGLGDGAKSAFASNPHSGLTTLPSAPAPWLQGRRSTTHATNVLALADRIHRHEDRGDRESSDRLLKEFFQGKPSEKDINDLLLAVRVSRLTPETMLTLLKRTRGIDSGARRRFFDEVRRRLYDTMGTKADNLLREVR